MNRARAASRCGFRRLLFTLLLAACGPAQMRMERESSAVGLPRPSAVYVYDFAVDPSAVTLDPGGPAARLGAILAGPGSTQDQQVIAVGQRVADRLSADLVEKITAMGLSAQRAGRGLTVPPGAVGITGQFEDIDEGNRLRRLAIGFRQGQSRVGAQVQLSQTDEGGAARPLLEFVAAAESAPLPGAAVTMGAGAAVQVASAAAGAKELGDTVQADADRLAGKIATSLQEFFAKQGWTTPPSTLQMP